MSDVRTTVDLYLDVNSSARVNLVAGQLYSATSDMMLWRKSQVIVRCRLYSGSATVAYNPPIDATWLFGIDNTYERDHDDLITTENADFNIGADWSGIDVINGLISWRIDLSGDALATAMGSTSRATMYAALWMLPNGGSYTCLAHWDIQMLNIAVDPED